MDLSNWDNLTPYTLRGSGENKSDADAIHARRPDVDQQGGERSNEPISLDVDAWEKDIWELDFPQVDAISHSKLLNRAIRVLEFAEQSGYVNESELDGENVVGYFNPVPNESL